MDYFRTTRWCNFFTTACSYPAKRDYGASSYRLAYHQQGAPWVLQGGRTVRRARAVRKVGCFPPPVATGPVLNSGPPMLF